MAARSEPEAARWAERWLGVSLGVAPAADSGSDSVIRRLPRLTQLLEGSRRLPPPSAVGPAPRAGPSTRRR
eukprot:scaffold1453_cov112-Isochrysis_galbana.AAC.26